MRTVGAHILDDKMEEAVTHYINTHQATEPIHIDTNGMPMSVPDDGTRVTVMHQQAYTTQMCRQVSVTEQVGDGPWSEELLDENRIAAIVAHLAQNQRTSHAHPPPHHKVPAVRSDVDTSVILDGAIRFNGQHLEQQDSIVVQLPPMQTLPPLQDMKRCQEPDWYTDKNKKDPAMLPDSDSPVMELSGASPAQHKQSKKSLPHKKRISRKLKRNNGSCTPQQDLVVLNCSDHPPEEQILPDNFVAVHQPEVAHHMQHEMRPILICQICGEFYGEEQVKFFHHLKQHYEPHGAIIIENPVSDLVMDKMTNTCIVDNVSQLPDSIVELSLENTKTMYSSIDKHILYTTSDKTLNYNSNKVHYSMASMEKESEKGDLYLSETLDKLDLYNCGKCSRTFRKQKQCEAHVRDAHSNSKLEEMNEFSEPEDLMAGIQVCVAEYERALLPTLTVDSGHVTQEHHRFARNNGVPSGYNVRSDTQPLKVLKEEVLQRIFENEVSTDNGPFADNIIHENDVPHHEEPDHDHTHHSHDHDHHNHDEHHSQAEHSHHSQEHSHHSQEHSHHSQEHLHHTQEHPHHSQDHSHHSQDHSHHSQDHSHHNQEHSHHSQDHSHHNQEHSHHNQEYIHHGHDHSNHGQDHINHENNHNHNHSHDHDHHLDNHEHSQHDNLVIREHENETQPDINHEIREQPIQNINLPKIKTEKDKSNKKKDLECTECGRVFQHRNSLLYHTLSHVGKQHLCRDCGNTFYTRTALKVHKRTHSGDKPYKCDECGRDFRQIGDLRYHKISLHSDKKHFKCEFCGKEFARKYSLNVHRRIHTGERNYACHYCNKTFRASSYRLAHMRTHTGDRPYKCEECEKCFRAAFDLRRHMHVHDKMRLRLEENKTKQKEQKKPKSQEVKEEKQETPKAKKVALASTTRLPNSILKKVPKIKKSSPKKGAPNVTLNKDFKETDYADLNPPTYETPTYNKFKDVYNDVTKDDIYKQTVYKDERDIATLRPIKVIERTDTDAKIQVFSHVVERSKDYPCSLGGNSTVLGDIRQDMRHLEREVRSDVIEGETMDSSSVFLERLTALYNIPA